MKRKLIYLLSLFAVLCIIFGCRQNTIQATDKINIPIKHKYEEGILTTTVGKLDRNSIYDIELNAHMVNMDDHNITTDVFEDIGESYLAKIEIPMPGEWVVEYSITDGTQFWFYTITENFSREGNSEDYYIVLNSSEDLISKGDKVEFTIEFLDGFGGMVKPSDINLELSFEEKKEKLTYANEDEKYIFNYIFDVEGIWNLDVTAKITSNTISETYLIPVGEDAIRLLEELYHDHDHHHEHHHEHEHDD